MHRRWLHQLADRAGIIPQYIDCQGHVQHASDLTCELLLAALGQNASTEEAAERSLKVLEQQCDGRALDPVRVAGGCDERSVALDFSVPPSWSGCVEWHVELRGEDGSTCQRHGCGEPAPGTRVVAIPLDDQPGIGYHSVH